MNNAITEIKSTLEGTKSRIIEAEDRISEVVLISFNSFFLSASFISTILSFASFILSSASVILLLVTSRVFDLNYCIMHYWLTLFYFFLVLVKHFLHLLSLCLQTIYPNFILFSRFWIIFTIIILNSFFQVNSLSPPLLLGLVGIYHAPLPVEYIYIFHFV